MNKRHTAQAIYSSPLGRVQMDNFIIFLFILTLSIGANAKLFKVSDQGNILKHNAKDWSCVLDDQSKLVWEVKKTKKGLQSNQNTYTWFDGKTGVENGEYSRNCNQAQSCNTQSFINALNKNTLCKSINWRLPSEAELKTLLRYGDTEPLINTNFFSNTKSKPYWSSDSVNADIAVDVPFFYGGTQGSDKSFDSYIRAVRNAK